MYKILSLEDIFTFYTFFFYSSIPIVPTFSPKVFVPFPLPQSPANIVPNPSIPIPRLIACIGGGGAPKMIFYWVRYLIVIDSVQRKKCVNIFGYLFIDTFAG